MGKLALTIAVLVVTIQTADARSCVLSAPAMEEQLDLIAAKGMMIRGRVVQLFDLDKRQSVIIEAEEIFIGEGESRKFKILHSFVQRSSDRASSSGLLIPEVSTCSDFGYTKGSNFERLILVPATTESGSSTEQTWRIVSWGSSWTSGPRLGQLVERADRLGRLKKRPPFRISYGDCEAFPESAACKKR